MAVTVVITRITMNSSETCQIGVVIKVCS